MAPRGQDLCNRSKQKRTRHFKTPTQQLGKTLFYTETQHHDIRTRVRNWPFTDWPYTVDEKTHAGPLLDRLPLTSNSNISRLFTDIGRHPAMRCDAGRRDCFTAVALAEIGLAVRFRETDSGTGLFPFEIGTWHASRGRERSWTTR